MERRLYAYTYARVPYDDAIELLVDDAQEILQDATDRAAGDTDEIVTTLHVGVGDLEVGREIRIETGDFRPVEVLRGELPITWHAAEAAALFPSVDATLELRVVSLEPPLTQVALRGAYSPPLGALGAAGDAVVGHRVAELAIRGFVDDVADRLEAALGHASGR